MIGGAIGFYDGLFGPGTGGFLMFLFIRFFAFDFLHASAAAKVVNLSTNIAALGFFLPTGNVLLLWHCQWPRAIFWARCRAVGWRCIGAQGLCGCCSWC